MLLMLAKSSSAEVTGGYDKKKGLNILQLTEYQNTSARVK